MGLVNSPAAAAAGAERASLVKSRFRPLLVGAIAAIAIPLLLFLWPAGGTFLYDDARMIIYNVGSLEHLVRSFVELRDGFYRPVYEIAIGLEGLLFGLNPVPYHLVSILLHIACTWCVYRIAQARTGRLPATLAALLFWGGGTHVEAIFWVSAVNSQLAALGCLAGTLALQRAGAAPDSRSADRWLAVGIAAWLLGVLAKENAFTWPLAMAALWCIEGGGLAPLRPGWRRRFLLPAVALMAVYAPLRLLAGTSYNLVVTPLLLLKNSAYYAVSYLSTLPDDYRYLSDLSAWQNAPWLGLACLVGLLPGLLWLVRRRRQLAFPKATAWLVWSALLTLPSLPILAEREGYLPAAGVSLALAALLAPVLRNWRPAQNSLTSLGAVALIALFGANWLGLAERSYWWNEAAGGSQLLVAQTVPIIRADPPETVLAVFNVPDRAGFAHVQGGHFSWTVSLFSAGQVASGRTVVRTAPNDGFYTAEEAVTEAKRRFGTGAQARPVRVLVFQGYKLALSQLVVP
ncbi:MAG: hypothetical protein M1401_12730 [Chloroflexi bacterium]|nr:hypothetical protein [Chloroflexota bacterium]